MKKNLKLKTLAVAVIAVAGMQSTFAQVTDVGNIFIQANTDNSGGNEGVFITSNGVGNGGLDGGAGARFLTNGSADVYGGSLNLIGRDATNITGAGNVTIGNANNTTTIQSGTNNINGTTNITGATTVVGTTSVTGTTNINTTGASQNTVIGNVGNDTYLNSAYNDIGTAVGYDSYTTIGNNRAGTTIDAQAGNASMSLANNSASLTVPSGAAGVNNGVAVSNTKASITGGNTSPTRMTMTDNAATFSRVSNGAPITVTGVADGKNDFDAINVRQFAGAIAAVAAQANVPALAAGQTRTVGIGLGNFMSKTGLALGMNLRGDNNATYKLSVSTGLNGGAKAVIGAGAAWAF
jgi:hypothetical protein